MQLLGHSAAVDSTVLARLCHRPGPAWMATLVQAALACPSLALAASRRAGAGHRRIAELSAAGVSYASFRSRRDCITRRGGRFGSSRCARTSAEWRQAEHRFRATVLDLSQSPPVEFTPLDGWARLIEHVLRTGRISFLASQFSKRRFELTMDDLPALGLQLMEEFDDTVLPAKRQEERAKPRPTAPAAPNDWLDGLQRRTRRIAVSAAARRWPCRKREARRGRRRRPGADRPEVLARLERLDDLVIEAIDGDAKSLAQLRQEWPNLHEELGAELLADSREQYLRHALCIWQGSVEPHGLRDPARAVHALEVLCILFDDV